MKYLKKFNESASKDDYLRTENSFRNAVKSLSDIQKIIDNMKVNYYGDPSGAIADKNQISKDIENLNDDLNHTIEYCDYDKYK